MFQGNIKIASYFLNFFSLTIGIPDPGVYFPILNFDTSRIYLIGYHMLTPLVVNYWYR